jgi:3-phenylpropionate/cinnamic acid dioxygenase small subunit
MAEPMLFVASLNSRYAEVIDADRLEEWPDFFVEHCLYKITSADNLRAGHEAGIVYADSRAMLVDRVVALRKANIYERQSYRHIIAMPVILSETDGEIRAETPFIVIRTMRDGRMNLFATGVYRDCINTETRRFRERIVVCDSSRFDTLVAIPL